ncbi:MAG: 50S ribosomal protein L21 [Candidatus Paceibacterota bacterium]|jgi:large subunit ribosomal protein L21|nr:50S ribosomal protein L21 [Candidatus Paceibacterota bacterium]MDD5555322.1 50S ribosomal protein L21 [Candidatus Paceibacterota bacterium]
MLAIIKTGGKQYKVSEGDKLKIEKKEGEEIVFTDVLLLDNGKKTVIGTPLVEGAEVKARVLKQGRAPKVTIFKYKPKKRYKLKKGHRQPFTEIEIIEIKG